MDAVKMTGVEWKRFYVDDAIWGDSGYHDDTVIIVNGVEIDASFDLSTDIKDTDTVEVQYGSYYRDRHDNIGSDIVELARDWMKSQLVTVLTVEVPKDKIEEFKALLANFGAVIK
jgi:hypothetical protein